MVSCSIVSFNHSPADLAGALDSIACCGLPVRLYLVDNSPSPVAAGLAHARGAIYMHLPQNPGFGRGHNFALRDAIAHGNRYHLVMNPDVRFGSDVLPVMIGHLDRHADVGMAAPRVQYPDGRLQRLCKLLPDPLDLALRRFCPGLHRSSGRQARYELHGSGYDRVMDVPVLSGCFMLLRTSVIARAGLFDERFFMYFEDVDLTRRVGRVARTVYFPDVSIVHDYAKGSYRQVGLMCHHIRSAVRYFNKWGWFNDSQRDRINRAALHGLQAPVMRQPAPDLKVG